MRQLVADHVDGDGETVEDLAVAVAEHHLLAVPESVLVLLAVVHAADQRQPFIIQRIAPVGLPEEIVGDAEIVVGLVHRHVVVAGLPLLAHLFAGQLGAVLGVVDIAERFAGSGVFLGR